MSGLNPFRLSRKPDALPVTTQFVDDSLFAPPGAAGYDNENGNEDIKAFDAQDNEDQNPAAATPTAATTASTTESTRDVDTTSVSSDDGSTSDPFRQASHLSDNDRDSGSYKETRRDSAVQPDGLSSAPPTSADISTKESNTLHPKSAKRASRPLPPPPTGSRTANSSSTDVSQLSTRSGTVNKRTSVTDIDTRSLSSRSGNREKKPPPPPKSHHGKLINNPVQPVPAESKRFSFHDSSSETSFNTPSTPSQSSKPSVQVDYFSSVPNESQNPNQNSNPRATDTLKRSQSQYKRPPTPPLSRRHSQMKRSKSTLSSKQNQNRLSLPVGSEGVKPSPPPSPGTTTTSLNPPVQRASRPLSLQTDENTLKSTSSLKEQAPSPLSPTAESPLSRTTSIRRTTSGSSSAAAPPPPPPPRRARYSNDSTRPASYVQPKKTEEESSFQPSNANNILEDLSRLQKEVDDLRGRYESRQGSH
ncbi:uncharacterized protein ASPGLDRAFT_149291 [Aspergillus glaucus CBS 516.65]|uniref:Uncharacterized protein n=1 Tax=Aspergillus glaucus CBS 516.65 TaxID=1160497 RepID=A0A1L9VJT7_ASPGL|nr:hypothetical protein ASPGLDRAFT_149291 [Aspergillus glaucus CBS 516.65]OJJ84162.1 hypothetical protein ASPGLDRAFT_149291 [Aspergillus glaucus CBS 516.65]